VDSRIPILLTAGVVIAYFTARAGRSGEMINKYSTVRRANSPRLFQAGLVFRWALAAVCILGAVAVALGWVPLSS
jgi:hypothetical protein